MSGHDRIIVCRAGHLSSQLLQGLPLRFGNQQRGENPAKHEQGEDLHHVVQPRGRVLLGDHALGPQGTEDDLGDDGADFSRCSAEAVGGGAVAGREAFAGDDEGGGVGAEVEEELAEDV